MNIILGLPGPEALELVERSHLYHDDGDLIQVLRSSQTQESRLVCVGLLMTDDNARAVGVALTTNEAQVQVFIEPFYRRSGLGSLLVSRLIQHAPKETVISYWGGLNDDETAIDQYEFWKALSIPSFDHCGCWSVSREEHSQLMQGSLSVEQIKARRISERRASTR